MVGTTGRRRASPSPSRRPSVVSSGWAWIWLWWRWQSSARLSRVVGPPRDHQVTWWASHSEGGVVQPGQTQPRSRAARAVCWAAVASRPRVSIASTRPAVSRTTRSMTASHAIRVSAPRSTRSPSVVVAAPAPSAPASWSGVVTTTTRGTPPGPARADAVVLGRGAGHLDQGVGSALTPGPHVRRRISAPSARSAAAGSVSVAAARSFSTKWSSTVAHGQPAGLVELAAEQDHPGLVGRDTDGGAGPGRSRRTGPPGPG